MLLCKLLLKNGTDMTWGLFSRFSLQLQRPPPDVLQSGVGTDKSPGGERSAHFTRVVDISLGST